MSGMSDDRFIVVVMAVTRVVMAVIVALAFVVGIKMFQPIVRDLAGQNTNVDLNLVMTVSLAVNLVLGAGVGPLIWRVIKSNRRIKELEFKKRPKLVKDRAGTARARRQVD